MKRMFVSAVLTLVAVLGLSLDIQANGLFRRHRGCESGCEAAPCAAAAPCAPVAAPAPAPAPIQYVEQKVTRYKQEMSWKEIEELVCKRVNREEKYTYTVCVPVTKQETRKQTTYTRVEKQVPYTYTVCVPVTVAEKRQQTCYTRVEKQVPYTYTVMVPRTVQKTVKQTTYQCVNETITEQRPVCRTVPVSCVDACGNCITRCERVTTMEPCTRTVVKRVPVTRDVVVNEVVCEAKTMNGTRVVCELVPQTKEVVVNVCRVETKTMQGQRTVCELVPQVKDVTVNVCTYVNEKRQGTRIVCETVTEKVKRKVQVCNMVPYTETIRVPVAAPCETCSAPSDSCGHRHGGLFRHARGCGGCN